MKGFILFYETVQRVTQTKKKSIWNSSYTKPFHLTSVILDVHENMLWSFSLVRVLKVGCITEKLCEMPRVVIYEDECIINRPCLNVFQSPPNI